MKNIFENAKFGDFFLTRDGKKAVFIRHMNTDDVKASCVIEGWFEGKLYHADGKVHYDYGEYDIVGKWKENIDEEELDELLMQLLICAQQGYTQCAPDEIVIRNMKKILKAKEG